MLTICWSSFLRLIKEISKRTFTSMDLNFVVYFCFLFNDFEILINFKVLVCWHHCLLIHEISLTHFWLFGLRFVILFTNYLVDVLLKRIRTWIGHFNTSRLFLFEYFDLLLFHFVRSFLLFILSHILDFNEFIIE